MKELTKLLILGALVMVLTFSIVAPTTWSRPANKQQCYQNCYKAFSGNQGALKACLSRCDARW